MEDHEKIELRSEKVRNIIGQVPPALVRSGIGIVFALVVMLLLAAYLIPYPETVTADVVVKTATDKGRKAFAEALIPYAYVAQVSNGMRVEVEIEGYMGRKYGLVSGRVAKIDKHLVSHRGRNYFVACLLLTDEGYGRLQVRMKGTASILLSEESIWRHIFRN